MFSAGGSSGASTQQQQLDPQIKAMWTDLVGKANAEFARPAAGYNGEMVAGLNPVQQQGVAAAQAAATDPAAKHYLDSANDAFQNVNDVSATTGAQGMGAYKDHYTNDVVDATLADIEQQRQRAINGNSSTATLQGGEGAASGSRAGVSDSLTNEAALKQAAMTAAQLRSAGFNTEASLGQTDADRALQANIADNSSSLATGAALQGLGVAQSGLDTNAASTLLNAGGQAQATKTAQDQAAYQEFLRQQGIPEERLKEAAIPFGFYPTTASGGTSQTNSSGKSGSAGWGG
jgi:hypothetical protein